MTTSPSRPLVRWLGGKWSFAPKILNLISDIPHGVYVEPFGGSASVLLQKAPVRVEVYNDLDSNLVNLFRMIREKPEDLIRALQLTPYSLEEAQAVWNTPAHKNPIE